MSININTSYKKNAISTVERYGLCGIQISSYQVIIHLKYKKKNLNCTKLFF